MYAVTGRKQNNLKLIWYGVCRGIHGMWNGVESGVILKCTTNVTYLQGQQMKCLVLTCLKCPILGIWLSKGDLDNTFVQWKRKFECEEI